MSPFLFILVSDCLDRLLYDSTSLGELKSNTCGTSRTSSLTVNHLQFADDALLFYSMDDKAIENLF